MRFAKRPIHHWLDSRIRSHVFLYMLAYYVEWQMRRKLAPILFEDDEKEEGAERLRRSTVAPAERSAAAKQKTRANVPTTATGPQLPDLAGRAGHAGQAPRPHRRDSGRVHELTEATPAQQQALDLLGVTT